MLIDNYRLTTGEYPGDSSTGTTPPELADQLHPKAWEAKTPLGGYWDIESNGIGSIPLAVGVHYKGVPDNPDAMQAVDEQMDDGDLKTGAFQKIDSGRYYLILEN